MEKYRVTFAIISIALGIAVLLFAFWNVSRSKIKKKTKWAIRGYILYGFLFVVFGVILWQKGISSQYKIGSESVAPKPVDNPIKDSSSKVALDSAKVLKENGHIVTSSEIQPVNSQYVPKVTNNAVVNNRGKLNKGKETSSESPADSPTSHLLAEEKVYININKVFTWVEKLFNKYGVESKPDVSHKFLKSTKDLDAELTTLVFPHITFEPGTSNLTSVSRAALSALSDRLKKTPEIKVIEIQAFTNDQSPEAFNYILSESRARAVRDYLIGEGVESDRLVAKGFGAYINDTLQMPVSRIEFVARPQ